MPCCWSTGIQRLLICKLPDVMATVSVPVDRTWIAVRLHPGNRLEKRRGNPVARRSLLEQVALLVIGGSGETGEWAMT
jgi:hypothetical protein